MIWSRFIHILPAAALVAGALAGCSDRPAAPPPPLDNIRTFQVKGVVQRLESDGKSVVIRHEKITNYMDAMTMSLEVRDTNELAGLAPGDAVSFRMLVTEEDGWIDQIRKLGTNVAAPPREAYRQAPMVEPLRVGDAIPNYYFTNQLGRPISLQDFRGQALAITFIYTRCPYPNFCPRMSNRFLDAQKKLKARPGGPANWHLLCVSFDPAYDTPARLKAYAETWQQDPARWSFATGDLWTLDGITEQCGLQFWREENAVLGHNVRAVVIDAAGRLQRVLEGNEWKADELVEELVKAAKAK